jgi:hypothetical protein
MPRVLLRIRHEELRSERGVVIGTSHPLPPRAVVLVERHGWTEEGTDLYLITETGGGRRFLAERIADVAVEQDYLLLEELRL